MQNLSHGVKANPPAGGRLYYLKEKFLPIAIPIQ
jgi:hypothetical protein